MTELATLRALIVEPNAAMRTSLQDMLLQCEPAAVDHVHSAGSAIRALQQRNYELILCEYELGAGQDGQQLLEDLRQQHLIPLSTVFIMITAERAYQKVVGAAELAPTDYILKPFSVERLRLRIRRALERRALLLPVHQLLEHGEQHAAIEACRDGARQSPGHAAEFLRLRAELQLAVGDATAAESTYRQLLQDRNVGWARLGLAKCLLRQARHAEAASMLQALVAEQPSFLDAYDSLAQVHEALGQLPAAQAVLQQAADVSPHALARLRRLGRVALDAGDLQIAEYALKQVVGKSSHSEFRDPEDQVQLVKTLLRLDQPEQAVSVIRELDDAVVQRGKGVACAAIAKAMLHEFQGDTAQLKAALEAAVTACSNGNDSGGGSRSRISADLKLELARNCLQHQREAAASELMLDVIGNAADEAMLAKTTQVLTQAGRPELASQLQQQSRSQVIAMVAEGAGLARDGDFYGAVELMTSALHKLPQNPQVVFNTAVALLKCLEHMGWEDEMGGEARALIATLRRLDPAYPQLGALAALYRTILQKYGRGRLRPTMLPARSAPSAPAIQQR